jgi:glycerol-3-phosphate acyltransferase PlsY
VSADWLYWSAAFPAVVLAYGLGSLSSAIVIAKAFHLTDPRSVGSGNPGATNMLRVGGKPAAAATLAGDVLKGVIPVALAQGWLSGWALALVALAAFLGHLFPVFFGFRGGKGVATALGVYLALAPLLAAALVATWLVVAGISRYSSLAALVAAVAAPLWTLWLYPTPPMLILALVLAGLLLWKHSDNMARLRAGTEGKIGQKG